MLWCIIHDYVPMYLPKFPTEAKYEYLPAVTSIFFKVKQ